MKCVCMCFCITEGTCVVYLLESRTTYECSLSKRQILLEEFCAGMAIVFQIEQITYY